MTTRSVGREAAGWRQVERAQQAGRHRIRYWNQVGLGQSGFRVRLGGLQEHVVQEADRSHLGIRQCLEVDGLVRLGSVDEHDGELQRTASWGGWWNELAF